jgi:predicted nucleotidyltransferase
MILNSDFLDFLTALNDQDVEYLVVGGYAVIIHGYNRTTGDIDIWINKTKDNYQKLATAFLQFGMPLFDMTAHNFLENEDFDVFTFGVPPISIDIMTKLKGLTFDECVEQAFKETIDGLIINVISIEDLIAAKKASNRAKDQDDIEHLEK